MHALRVEWPEDGLPSRPCFMAAIEAAYGSIEIPYFPFRAWVEIVTGKGEGHVEAGEPQDQGLVGPVLWNAVVTAGIG